MLRSVELQNFRAFDRLHVGGLQRVNLIAGKNNVGKTALLEGVCLLLKPDEAHGRLQELAFRGMIPVTQPEDLFPWLFRDRNPARPIRLAGTSDDNVDLTAEIRLIQPAEWPSIRRPFAKANPDLGEAFPSQLRASALVLQYRDTLGRIGLAHTGLGNGVSRSLVGAASPDGVFSPLASVRYLPSAISGERKVTDAERFSDIVRSGDVERLTRILISLEPRLRGLSLLILGGAAVIHGDVGLTEPVPIPMMGEGMGRVLSLLLAIASTPGGVVLVDEIENGLHHTVLPDVWKAVGQAAESYSTQILATTHSYECIEAAQQAFCAPAPCEFRLHRLDRVNEDIRAVTYDPETLALAVREFYEVR